MLSKTSRRCGKLTLEIIYLTLIGRQDACFSTCRFLNHWPVTHVELAVHLRQLAAIYTACESLVPPQDKRFLKKTVRCAKNLYYANTVKKKIKLLDERIRRAHQRFTVCYSPNVHNHC